MNLRFLPDTNAIIGLIKGTTGLRQRFMRYQTQEFGLSVVVLYELFYGASKSSPTYRDGNFKNIAHLPFEVLAFNAEDARVAGDIRADLHAKGTPVGAHDILIAAQAKTRGLTLITHNTREFERIHGLKLQDWLPG